MLLLILLKNEQVTRFGISTFAEYAKNRLFLGFAPPRRPFKAFVFKFVYSLFDENMYL